MADETTNDRVQGDAEAAALLADAVDADDSQEENGQQFDADAAKAKITKANREAANLRKRLKELEPLAQRAQELEDANKSETERLTEQLQAATTDGATSKRDLLRLNVALAKAPEGMTPAKILSLAGRLKGSTQEELEQDAEELFSEFAPAANGGGSGQRPKEDLPTVPLPNSKDIQIDDEKDPRVLAKRIRRV